MLDYIIVGSGLSGISFAEVLKNNNKTFIVFENNSQNSSRIAAGLYNPVILKRFSAAWNATVQLNYADIFYNQLEQKLNTKIDFNLPIYRRFHSIEEQNNWFLASDKPILSFYLSPNIITKSFQNIPSPFGYGELLQTGFVDTNILLNEYHYFLHSNNQLKEETFQYDQIQFENNWMQYNDIKTKSIVFAEGFGNQYNPFFNYLPLDGTKGEILIIKAPDLAIDFILNTSVFFLPLGNHLFKVGATYNWNDKSSSLTHEGKNELVQKIKDSISCSFEVVEHYAGIRPTVNDRRPLLGRHPRYENLFVLNGMGTRGVMLAPILAEELYLYIEENRSLDKSIDIIRYLKFFK